MSSLDRILPFLRPIEDLLRDPAITELMVNDGGRRVFVERAGGLELVPDRTLESRNLTVAIKNIARACGDEISEMQPILDARLEDGSRVAAMFPPCAVAGPALTIRKFGRRYTLEDLVAIGTLSSALAQRLVAAIAAERNILISGGTGTGKTTLLNALAARIPDSNRIVVIEETAEIHLDKPNLLRFEARRAQMPLGHETPLPDVTRRWMPLPMARDVTGQQPMHPESEVVITWRPQHQVKVVRQQTVGQHTHRHAGAGRTQQDLEESVIVLVVEDAPPAIATVEHMVTVAAPSGTCGARHGVIIRPGLPESKKNLGCPGFPVLMPWRLPAEHCHPHLSRHRSARVWQISPRDQSLSTESASWTPGFGTPLVSTKVPATADHG